MGEVEPSGDDEMAGGAEGKLFYMVYRLFIINS